MKAIVLYCVFLLTASTVFAQTIDHKILFDVSTKDTSVHQATLRHVTMMSKAYPDAQFAVLIYGGALDMVLKDKSVVADQIIALAPYKNVSFKICKVTMDRMKVDKSQLLKGVETVPDAIIEIVSKQKEGWGYIKEAH